jgi:hypothetical protein
MSGERLAETGSGGRGDSGLLAARVAELGRELDRDRFGGGNPVVVVPPGAGPLEVAARALAAERMNALLRLDGREYNPREDRADADLQRALAALRAWSFGAAESLLDTAGSQVREPALQQRIGVWKLLARLVRRLVMTDLDEELRGDPGRRALEQVDGADRVPSGEREHYRVEIGRLVAEHRAAGQGAAGDGGLSRTLWLVLRARLALAAGEPLPALGWCLRAAGATADRLAPDEYLANLLAQGRQFVLLAVGELSGDAAAEAREATKGLQAWDLYRALVARLGEVYGLDVHRETARFSIASYQDLEE